MPAGVTGAWAWRARAIARSGRGAVEDLGVVPAAPILAYLFSACVETEKCPCGDRDTLIEVADWHRRNLDIYNFDLVQ